MALTLQLDLAKQVYCLRTMKNVKETSVITAVKEQYEKFPYPHINRLEIEDSEHDLRASFNHEFKLQGSRKLEPGCTMWVPGCGTRWAVMLALQFKDARIIASDLSKASLNAQAALAGNLDISNIEFRNENLLTVPYEEKFDFISCVGVLHHLPSPQQGFDVIYRALKPTGLAEIMVYDHINRHYSIRMQNILNIFDADRKLNAQSRFELAAQILRALNQHARTPPELKRVLNYLDSVSGFSQELADFISHPQEHYFDVPSLLSSLDKSNLQVHSWKMPYFFDPTAMLDDSSLKARVSDMADAEKAHLGHLLSSGFLEVYIERKCNRGAVEAQDIRKYRVRAIPNNKVIKLHDNKVSSVEEKSKTTIKGGRLLFDGGERRPAVSSYGYAPDCITMRPRRLLSLSDLNLDTELDQSHVDDILDLAKTSITIDEIVTTLVKRYDENVNEEQLVKLCGYLCRTPYRLLAIVN